MASTQGPTTALTVQQRNVMTLRQMLDKQKEQIALALPKHLTPERMIRVAMTAVQKTPKLQECDALSIVGAVVQASQLGLEPDGFLGQSYLVPFWNGKARKMEAQLQVGYRGFITLARRSGEVSWISAELVYNCDQFHVEFGSDRQLKHVPDLDNAERGAKDEQGNPIGLRGAYAVVKYKDGASDFEYMSLTQLNQIRASSKAKDKDGAEYGPWVTHPEEMYRKCPIRRLAKRLPLSPEFMQAAVMDEYAETGIAQNLAAEVDVPEVIAVASNAKADALNEKYLKPPQPVTEAINQTSADEIPIEAYAADPSEAPEMILPQTSAPTTHSVERHQRRGRGTPTDSQGLPGVFDK